MSTVLWYKGKFYSDSQGTNGETGEKFYNTNKMFIVDGKKYAVTGTLVGWYYFQEMMLDKRLWHRFIMYLLFFKERKSESSSIVSYDDSTDELTAYDPVWYGWTKTVLDSSHKNRTASMGSGTRHWTDEERKSIKDGEADPYRLLSIAMDKDEFSGGRIVIL